MSNSVLLRIFRMNFYSKLMSTLRLFIFIKSNCQTHKVISTSVYDYFVFLYCLGFISLCSVKCDDYAAIIMIQFLFSLLVWDLSLLVSIPLDDCYSYLYSQAFVNVCYYAAIALTTITINTSDFAVTIALTRFTTAIKALDCYVTVVISVTAAITIISTIIVIDAQISSLDTQRAICFVKHLMYEHDSTLDFDVYYCSVKLFSNCDFPLS